MYNFPQCGEMMQPKHKMITHFAVTSQQFRINFMPAVVIGTVLPITQMTMRLLYNSFRLLLIYVYGRCSIA